MAAENERMTFNEYLQTQDTDDSFAFEVIKAEAEEHNDYRVLSLIFADVFRDKFERLWYDYETELDRQNYEAEQESRIATEPGAERCLLRHVLDFLRGNTNKHE